MIPSFRSAANTIMYGREKNSKVKLRFVEHFDCLVVAKNHSVRLFFFRQLVCCEDYGRVTDTLYLTRRIFKVKNDQIYGTNKTLLFNKRLFSANKRFKNVV